MFFYLAAPSFQVNNRQPDCCVINADCQVPECFQFSIPPYDPFYSRFNITCHQLARSLPSKDARCRYGKKHLLVEQLAVFFD